MYFSARKYSDAELLAGLKSGNRKLLLYLFKRYRRHVKRFVISNGGNASDANPLLGDALLKVWNDAAKNVLLPGTQTEAYLLGVVEELWRNKHDEISIRNYIEQRTIPKVNLRIVPAVLGILLLSAIGLWWYMDNEPVERIAGKENVSDLSIKSDSMNVPKNTPAERPRPEKLYKAPAVSLRSQPRDSITALSHAVSAAAGSEKAAISDSTGEDNAMAAAEDIVVRKDELMVTRSIRVLVIGEESGQESTPPESTLAGETAAKLNPEAALPQEEKEPAGYSVEFWKSPINYRGYKMGKGKIIVYGLEYPELTKLYLVRGNYYLENAQAYYQLRQGSEFQVFYRVNDSAILAQLKK